MVDVSKSEGSSDRQGTDSKIIWAQKNNSFHLVSAVGTVSHSKHVLPLPVLFGLTRYYEKYDLDSLWDFLA